MPAGSPRTQARTHRRAGPPAQRGAPIIGERRNLVDTVAEGKASPAILQRLVELDIAAENIESNIAELQAELDAVETRGIEEDNLRTAVASFDPIWNELLPRERARRWHVDRSERMGSR